MSEYIRKQDAVDAVNHALDRETIIFSFVRKVAISALKKITPADVAPVVHGRWIGYDDTERFAAQCSLCGNEIDTRFGSNFCPNCGAKMRGEQE